MRAWIGHCISTVRFPILINNAPSKFFSSPHGLKTDDPLSFLLFVVVMETLSRMMSATMDKVLLSRSLVGSRIMTSF